MAKLIGVAGVYRGMECEIEGALTLGRDSALCNVLYTDCAQISGVHCRVENLDGQVYVTDLNSTNGTWHEDGRRFSPEIPEKVDQGEIIYLGNKEEGFRIVLDEMPDNTEQENDSNQESSKKKGHWKIAVAIAVIAVIVGVCLFFQFSKAAKKEDSVITETETSNKVIETEKTEVPKKESVSEEEIKKAEEDWNNEEELLRTRWEEIEPYLELSNGLTEEDFRQMINGRLVQAYEENTAIGLEIKSLLMASFDENAPKEFRTYTDDVNEAIDNLPGKYIESHLGSALSFIGNETVQGILSDGIIDGASAYLDGGSIDDALESAKNSVTEGVESAIQSAPYAAVGALLDGTVSGLGNFVTALEGANSAEEYFTNLGDSFTGGLISSCSGMKDKLDSSGSRPGALMNGLYSYVKSSATSLQEFLVSERVTSDSLSEGLYQYGQFGEAMDLLKSYGAGVSFEWQDNYKTAEALYRKFLSNEMLIGELSALENNAVMPTIPEISFTDLGEKTEYTMPVREEQENDDAYYNRLVRETGEMTDNVEKLDQALVDAAAMMEPLNNYRSQVNAMRDQCKGLLNYDKLKFEVTLNTDGIEKMDRINQFNAATGELTSAIPVFGNVISIFFSGIASTGDRYYTNQVKTAQGFSNGFTAISTEAQTNVDAFKERLSYFEDLTAKCDSKREELQNMLLLQCLYGDIPLDCGELKDKAYQSLYMLEKAFDVTATYYVTLNPNSVEKMQSAAHEIEAVIQRDEMEGIANTITPEALGQRLIPIMKAGVEGLDLLDDRSIDNPEMHYLFVTASIGNGLFGGTRVHYTEKVNVPTHLYDGGIDIYYSNGVPLRVDGFYLLGTTVLNNDAVSPADGQVLYDEAIWMAEMVKDKEKQRVCYEHYYKLRDQGTGMLPEGM